MSGKKKLAFVGARGLVGSVLANLLEKDKDLLASLEIFLLSSSLAGKPCPHSWAANEVFLPAQDISLLQDMDIVLTCQGSDYTRRIHSILRKNNWSGFWLDSASHLRMEEDTTIVLDPVNLPQMIKAMEGGGRDFVVGNCTVSLILMALGGLFREGLVEWMSTMTYQSITGAGALAMGEFFRQTASVSHCLGEEDGPFLELDGRLRHLLQGDSLEREVLGAPLALGLIPWIDSAMPGGQSREEWKGGVEAAKILGHAHPLPWDGTCVRVGVLRCHSFGALVKISRDIPLKELEEVIVSSNKWVEFVPNARGETVSRLNPALVAGKPNILVGRVRKLAMGGEFLNVFSVGDQLLWGAALPLERMLKLLVLGEDSLL